MFNIVKQRVYPQPVYFPQTKQMRDDYKRLMAAALELKGWSSPTEVAEGLTSHGYEVSPQTMTNWKRRGLSRDAKLQASWIIGCRSEWLATGAGEMKSEREVIDANQLRPLGDPPTERTTLGLVQTPQEIVAQYGNDLLLSPQIDAEALIRMYSIIQRAALASGKEVDFKYLIRAACVAYPVFKDKYFNEDDLVRYYVDLMERERAGR